MDEKVTIRNYEKKDLEQLKSIIHTTIKQSYANAYPQEAIDYFLDHHSEENMEKDIPRGFTFMLELEGKVIASGSIVEDEIKRVFVLPEYQGKGVGEKTLLAGLACLKKKKNRFAELTVDSENKAASALYQSIGFKARTISLWYEKKVS